MGSIVLTIPELTDAELIFDERETKQILQFFWPDKAKAIELMSVNNDVRRLAQTLLIAAIQTSYAVGFVEGTFRAIAGRNTGIPALCQKLANRFTQHWFKNLTQRDLMNAKIYLMVRDNLAWALEYRLDNFLENLAANRTKGRSLTPVVLGRITILVRA